MKTLIQKSLLLSALSALTLLVGCTTVHRNTDHPNIDVSQAERFSRVMDNGDIVEEYRLGGTVRMVKITPSTGPAYYLYDKNGDGLMDNDDKSGISPTYWQLYRW